MNSASPGPIRRQILFVALVALAYLVAPSIHGPAAAQTTAARSATSQTGPTPSWDEPTFFLEAIAIDGLRHASPAPLLTQLRLSEGHSYAESELRRAIFRVKRLPFVYDASMRLEKGSERGRFVLHVEIVETTRLFLVYDGVFRYRPAETIELELPDFENPEQSNTIRYRQESSFDSEGDHLTAGGRWFLGTNGLFFGTVNTDGASLGYTHYNLFGSQSFATFALRKAICCDGSSVSRENDLGIQITADLEATLAVGVPIAKDHSLQLNLTWATGDDTETALDQPTDLDQDSRGLDLRWFYDTTDDPFFPSTGLRTSTAVGLFDNEFAIAIGSFGYASEAREQVASFSLVRYFDRSRMGIFWAGGSLQWRRRDETNTSDRELFLDDGSPFEFTIKRDEVVDATVATASVGWARDLFPKKERAKARDLRLEAGLDFSWFDISTSSGEFEPSPFTAVFEPDPEIQFTLAIAFRNRWSVVRLGVGYREGGQR